MANDNANLPNSQSAQADPAQSASVSAVGSVVAGSSSSPERNEPHKLIIFIILISVFLALIVIACIILKRFFNYRTMTNPANEAPLAACTYFDKSECVYKPASKKLTKSNMRDIAMKIRENKRCLYMHIPPLIYDNLNDVLSENITSYFTVLQENDKNSQRQIGHGGGHHRGQHSRHEQNIRTSHSQSSNHHIRSTNSRNFSTQESYYTTFDFDGDEASPMMDKKTFGQLRRRFLTGTGYVPKERPVISFSPIYDNSARGSNNQPNINQNQTTKPQTELTMNQEKTRANQQTPEQIHTPPELYELKGPGRSTFFRQQALEYALKIDKLLIKVDRNDRDTRLKRSTDCRYDKHFSIIKELKSGNDRIYYDSLSRVPVKSIYSFSNHIDSIRYGSEIYTFEKLQTSKRLVDNFSNEIIEKSGISWLSKYYKDVD